VPSVIDVPTVHRPVPFGIVASHAACHGDTLSIACNACHSLRDGTPFDPGCAPFEDMHDLRIRLMLRWAFLALPFQSASADVRLATTRPSPSPVRVSVDNLLPPARVLQTHRDVETSLKLAVSFTPALTRTVRRPGQPSLKAVTLWCRSATVSRVAGQRGNVVWARATAPKTWRPPSTVLDVGRRGPPSGVRRLRDCV